MSLTAIDRCTFGQHDSHDVTVCDGTRIYPCPATVCRDHTEHCYTCNTDLCPACMIDHKDGDCFHEEDETD
jgi:hypothetical protein